ncbi:hypothetical protein HanRHA438_Chr04g0180651 [Helianthus annuus]|nr:hypothetical protein HanRHA438_Chr04g0180651 [Helianthus annuus]
MRLVRLEQPQSLKLIWQHKMAKVKVTDVVKVIIVVVVMVMAVVVVMVVDVADEIIIVFSLKTKGPTKSGIIMKINLVMKKIKRRWDLYRMHVTDVEVIIIDRRLVVRPNTWWNFINNLSKTKQKE